MRLMTFNVLSIIKEQLTLLLAEIICYIYNRCEYHTRINGYQKVLINYVIQRNFKNEEMTKDWRESYLVSLLRIKIIYDIVVIIKGWSWCTMNILVKSYWDKKRGDKHFWKSIQFYAEIIEIICYLFNKTTNEKYRKKKKKRMINVHLEK